MPFERNLNSLIACEECGLVVNLPIIHHGHKAVCPRCKHTLTKVSKDQYRTMIAYVIACLIMLVLSLCFPFMSFNAQGLSQEIKLLHAAQMLTTHQNTLLGLLLFTTVIVLPAIYITTLGYLYAKAGKASTRELDGNGIRHCIMLCRVLFYIQPWLMVDVFLVGVLVSLIKIASLAEVSMGSSFWTFCVFALLVVKCLSMVDKFWLWEQFVQNKTVIGVSAGDCHQTGNHQACHTCHQINPSSTDQDTYCLRCHNKLHAYNPSDNLQKSWALLIASIIFYIPANLYPMMYTVSLGKSEGSTIMEGVTLLWQLGSYPVSMVIFIASIVIPMAKMLTLTWLYSQAKKSQTEKSQAQKSEPESLNESLSKLKIYRITEFIGRWSMIDIFVVAILVALVQLQNVMAIYPGPAALSFAAVVILTMLSAMTFDSRLLWPVSSRRMPN